MDRTTSTERPAASLSRIPSARERHEEPQVDGRLDGPDAVVFEEEEVGPDRPVPEERSRFEGSAQVIEQLRVLRAHLRTQGLQRPLRCVGVVSAAQGEGKTTLALGLARVLGLDPDTRVLLVEADLRRPSVDFSVGAEVASEGLLQYLEGSSGTVTLRHLVRERFHFLPAGPRASNRGELLASPRMTSLIEAAKSAFDYVIVDCPPLTPVADTMMLRDLLDAFIFVVRSRHAPRTAVQRAIDLLTPARLCGVVFNAHREILTGLQGPAWRSRAGE